MPKLKVDGIDVILLDNMDCPRMASAVELRDKAGRKGKLALEASGGVTLETVRPIALTGVERIAGHLAFYPDQVEIREA